MFFLTKKNILFLFLPLLIMACGPDAKRDNPLDPVNSRGVNGTVYGAGGQTVANAIVTAVPANVSAKTDPEGRYNLDLAVGQLFQLTVNHPYYYSRTDSVNVPAGGRLVHNFILLGKPRIENAKILFRYVHTYNGDLIKYILPECMALHPDGSERLDAGFNLRCKYGDTTYLPKQFIQGDASSRKYCWEVFRREVTSGDIITFNLDSAGTVIQFFKSSIPIIWPLHGINSPENGDSLTIPFVMSWTNISPYVAVNIEIWKDTILVWHRNPSNPQQTICDAVLEGGRDYYWKVINITVEGYRYEVERKFYLR